MVRRATSPFEDIERRLHMVPHHPCRSGDLKLTIRGTESGVQRSGFLRIKDHAELVVYDSFRLAGSSA